ncbi:uncharacterized protein [Palaemon carinicauda]|uniref:uncharacterized protein n=1 Tax=Palaemon carinicauda TaxID=392227 RepID=UPI0035B663FD
MIRLQRLLWTTTVVWALCTCPIRGQDGVGQGEEEEWQNDLMALESNMDLTLAEVPVAPRLEDGSLAPEHRAITFPRYNVKRRQYEEPQFAHNAVLPPPRNPTTPLAHLGQQIGEYMRRIGDYFYWFVSGNPPVTLRRINGRLQKPGLPPIKRNFMQRTKPSRNKKIALRRPSPQQKFAKRKQKIAFLPHRPIDPSA